MEQARELESAVKSFLPYILKKKAEHLWIDYDKKVDVLYISFRKPQKAADSVMEGDFIFHYSRKKIVGITVLNAKEKL
ncbi:MAG: DUF2283 domain-containing protein [Deltaproteobacteria bacterium]|nr:DUF2283 domain-containing protein [Deltaproteobacteria bacterium]